MTNNTDNENSGSYNSYNSFDTIDMVPYNILSYLIENNDLIFKMLYYNDPNAWKSDVEHPNLTKVQKGSLIYDGVKEETSCRIFMDTGQNDSWQVESTQLRVSVVKGIPSNHVFGYVTIGFEIYSHYKVNTLSNRTTRDMVILKSLLGTLNGNYIEGLGKIFFDYRQGRESKFTTIGDPPYKGKGLTMCNYVLG